MAPCMLLSSLLEAGALLLRQPESFREGEWEVSGRRIEYAQEHGESGEARDHAFVSAEAL